MNTKNICFIVIPGFDEDTSSVAVIRQELEQSGYTAIAVNFWGSGDADFGTMTMQSAVAGLRAFIEGKAAEYDYVIGIGISLGGALLLEYAKEGTALDVIVGVGVPFRLRFQYTLAALTLLIFPVLKLWWTMTDQKVKWLASDKVLRYLSGAFQKDILTITTPLLVLQSTNDIVVSYQAANDHVAKLNCTPKKIVLIDDANHILAKNEPIIFSELIKFARSNESLPFTL